jgi:tetratricopeptide (TPR) repeat protein
MSIAFPKADQAPEQSRLLAEARALLERGNEDALRGEPAVAMAQYEEGLGLLAGQQHPVVADLLCRLGVVRTRLGETEEGEELFGQSLEMATWCGYLEGQAYAVNCLAVVAQRRGDLDVAEWQYRRAARLATEGGDYRLCGMVEQNLGTLANIRGDLDSAVVHYTKSLGAFERAGDTEGICWVLNNLGMRS